MTRFGEPELLRLGDERQAAAVLCASHGEYPSFRCVFPDPVRRADALSLFFSATIRDAIRFGAVHGVRDDERMVATSAWLPPGAFPWSARRKMRAMPAFLRMFAAYPGPFRRFINYGANLERFHPRDPHWYLVVLGVRPEAQRQGLGARLLEPMLHFTDDSGIACYLETSDPRNVSYYERFGFEVIDAALQLVSCGPAHMAMWRRPRCRRPTSLATVSRNRLTSDFMDSLGVYRYAR